MILYLKFDINTLCQKILQEQLTALNIKFNMINFDEVELKESVNSEKLKLLNKALENYSIEIVESQKNILVQKIKDTIRQMVFMEEKVPLKTSSYLSEKLNQSYGYLSKVFSAHTYTSIENYILQQKTERAKQLISTNELTITEIGWKLNYSSTAHFSSQFKNVTGLTPTAFQRILNKRRSRDEDDDELNQQEK